MAEAEIARHVEEANARWPLLGVTVIHRYGRIAAGREHRAGGHRVVAPRGGVRRGRVPDGLSEDPRAVLEAGRKRQRQGPGSRPRTPTMPPRSAGARAARGRGIIRGARGFMPSDAGRRTITWSDRLRLLQPRSASRPRALANDAGFVFPGEAGLAAARRRGRRRRQGLVLAASATARSAWSIPRPARTRASRSARARRRMA